MASKQGNKRKNWIQKAIKRPGDLKRKAKNANQTIEQYCANTKNKSKHTKQQCNFYKVLRKMPKKNSGRS